VQLALECIRINEGGFLERIPCPNPDDIGLLQVYRSGSKYFVFFRADIGADMIRRVRNLSAKATFHERARVERMLAEAFGGMTSSKFHTYLFPHNLNLEQAQGVVTIEKDGRRVFAIVQDGKVVSSCLSVRENAQAGECYIFTEPEYRCRGYGRRTVIAWAHHLQSLGKLPLYSHEESNWASGAVAKKLGLIPCFEVVTYNQESRTVVG